jgi:Mg2+ and Co2+ transporter CorA
VGELLADRANRLWLDVSDPGPEDVALLRREFGFHELALEDVTRPHERPRCDAYSGYYFIVVYAAEHTDEGFRPRELNLFWGENYLVTIHRRPAAVLAVLDQAQELLRVPRLLAPTSHVLAEVLRRDQAIPDGLRPYFADVQDHALHVLAELDTYRDLLGAALDVHVFHAFNRLGLIMKRLTAVTVIIMIPNFVAGIYGMNFNHLFPPSDWEYGFVALVAFLACMVAWGFIHSRRLGWL